MDGLSSLPKFIYIIHIQTLRLALSQHKKLKQFPPGQVHSIALKPSCNRLKDAMCCAVQYSPNDVLEPRHESVLSDFGSESDSDESDWDKFSSGEHSHENNDSLSQKRARTVEARKRESSLFGVTDKRASAPLK